MIHEIIIKDFVLIKEAQITLPDGFIAITGETGAGKSLVIQALKLLSGERGGPQFVRNGCQQAVLQALLDAGTDSQELLGRMGIEYSGELIVRRTISNSGKSRAYINNVMVTLNDLKRLMGGLLTIAGQHEYHTLLRPEKQRFILDAYAGTLHEVELMARRFRDYRSKVKELDELMEQREKWLQRRELIRQELDEIAKVDPRPGEEDELLSQRQILKSSATLRQLGEECYQTLYGRSGSVVETLAHCEKVLAKMTGIDHSLDRLGKEMETASLQIAEIASDLRSYLEQIPADLSRLEEIESRLYAIKNLLRKFGPEIEDVLEHRARLQEELERASDLDSAIDEAKAEKEALGQELLKSAAVISRQRHQAAGRLGKRVTDDLKQLKMKEAEFTVEVSTPSAPSPDKLSPHGMDEVRFLFRPNVGSPPRPLSEIASGGELSRVLLTLRSVIAIEDETGVMVFDEIDSGIGGEVALKVGEKLSLLAKQGQVIAVTHFPQIAAMADAHLKVQKTSSDEETISTICQLSSKEDRHNELVRMLGGKREAAAGFARELLKWE